jgi:APA family basic amino acid/polyamine antiporter
MLAQLLRRKSVDDAAADSERPEHALKRTLGPVDLTALGIGAIIGAGIFSATGTAAAGGGSHLGAGPALMVSYLLTAVACGFAALCYAELASMIPIAGSAYTYAYVTLGELLAWIIGWDLILEYAVGNIAVAVGWSGYFQAFLSGFGVHLPDWMIGNYNHLTPELRASAPHLFGLPIVLNLPAFVIVALLTVLLVVGVKESARFNTIMVVLKVTLVLAFIAVAGFFVHPVNWQPFAPNGFAGIMSGASLVFFAYIGFDAVSTTAEEAKNPQRDMPIGMIASLVICTVLYVALTAVITGITSYKNLGVADPLTAALQAAGLERFSGVMALGAVIAMTAVLLVFQLGQPRIFLSMARDGLLPRGFFGAVHPRFRTPWKSTILTGVAVGGVAMFVDINDAIEFTNIGTLFAFVLVSAGVITLRKSDPDRTRPFRCPAVPLFPILSIISCVALMLPLPHKTWIRFVGWLDIGFILYFCYGMRRSRLRDRGRALELRPIVGITVILVAATVVVLWPRNYQMLVSGCGRSACLCERTVWPSDDGDFIARFKERYNCEQPKADKIDRPCVCEIGP